jgi:hypothetical protein
MPRPKQVGVNGYHLASDLSFLVRWTEHTPEDLADSLWHAEKVQATRVVLDQALPVLVKLRELLR